MDQNRNYFKHSIVSILLVCCVLTFVAQDRVCAMTEIFVNGQECIITILLRKEFHQVSMVGITAWINKIDADIAKSQAVLDKGWFGNLFKSAATVAAERQSAQAQINWLTPLRASLVSVSGSYVPLMQPQLQALVDNWKQEIENKWNVPGYEYDCCKVNVKVVALLRGENDPAHQGFDQITIVPDALFRSYIGGFDTPFNANGFSDAPYIHDMSGAWRSGTRPNYTAPHEAGHEMGLTDQYSGANPIAGHEKDIMDGDASYTLAEFAALSAKSESGGLKVDNLATILKERNIKCSFCCPQVPPTVGTGTIIISSSGEGSEGVRGGEGCAAEVGPKDAVVTEQPQTPQVPDNAQSSEFPEGIQHKDLQLDDQVKLDSGVHYQDTQDGGMNIDTTSLATGKGPDFRKWEVTDTTILIDGEKVKPVEKDKFYVPKESAMRNVAVAVFVGLGSQYGDCAEEAESGEVCPVTGEPMSEGATRSGMDRAIDKAGMTAGLGLLASQAKGQIPGQKCLFKLDKQQAQKLKEGKAVLKVVMEHADSRARKKAEIPFGKVSY